MCLEDVKIGRATTGNIIYPKITDTKSQFIGQNNNRRVLILFPHFSKTVELSFSEGAGTFEFASLFIGNEPLILTRDSHGDIVNRAIWGRVGSGNATITVYQGVFDIDSFQKGF